MEHPGADAGYDPEITLCVILVMVRRHRTITCWSMCFSCVAPSGVMSLFELFDANADVWNKISRVGQFWSIFTLVSLS